MLNGRMTGPMDIHGPLHRVDHPDEWDTDAQVKGDTFRDTSGTVIG
jgi:hypothetical protein